jgi:hypothetical protein
MTESAPPARENGRKRAEIAALASSFQLEAFARDAVLLWRAYALRLR